MFVTAVLFYFWWNYDGPRRKAFSLRTDRVSRANLVAELARFAWWLLSVHYMTQPANTAIFPPSSSSPLGTKNLNNLIDVFWIVKWGWQLKNKKKKTKQLHRGQLFVAR